MKDENFEFDVYRTDNYYYQHSKYPLQVSHILRPNTIEVTVSKYFKGREIKNQTTKTKIINKMTKEQIEEFCLDCVYKFIKL